jgi:hypothetical protein
MAQITGGLVSVEDSKPHSNDEYGRKKVRVDLSFAVGEGEDYTTTFDLASEAATNRVAALLNGTALRVVGGTEGPAAETPASPPAETPRRTRRTAAQIAADNAAKAASSSGASNGGSAGGGSTSDDPAAIGGDDPTGGEEHVVHLPDESESFDIEPETPAEESFDIEPETPAGEPITDADLNSAVQKKNAEIANPNAIRALISSYNPDPKAAFQLRQIDPAKRAEFIAKLAALTKEKASA